MTWSPEFNPIENLGAEFKRCVCEQGSMQTLLSGTISVRRNGPKLQQTKELEEGDS